MAEYVVIRPPDWPVGNPVNREALNRVLAQFDHWHPIAVQQLAELDGPPDRQEDKP